MTQMLWTELITDVLPTTAGIQTSVKLWAGNWIPQAAGQLLSPHTVEAVLHNYRSLHKASREKKNKKKAFEPQRKTLMLQQRPRAAKIKNKKMECLDR